MKTPIVQAWEMALGRQVDDEAFQRTGADAPTLAGVVISFGQGRGEEWLHQAALPPGCVSAVRYVER